MEDITVTYLDHAITISGFRVSCRERRNRYLSLADSAEKKYLTQYYDKYGDFFTFADKYIEDVSDFLSPYYDSMINELVENGIYDANKNDVFQEYGEFLAKSLFDFQDGLKELYKAIDDG